MKRRVLSVLLVMMMLLGILPAIGEPSSSSSIHQYVSWVQITGTCNVRRGPGEDCEIIDKVYAGEELEYWDKTVIDVRGVKWYNVIYGNIGAWVSSKYAKLEGAYAGYGENNATTTTSYDDMDASAIEGLIEESGLADEYTFADPGAIADALKDAEALNNMDEQSGERVELYGWLGRSRREFDAAFPDAEYVLSDEIGALECPLTLFVEDDTITGISISAESIWMLKGYYVGMSSEDYKAREEVDDWPYVDNGNRGATLLLPDGNTFYREYEWDYRYMQSFSVHLSENSDSTSLADNPNVDESVDGDDADDTQMPDGQAYTETEREDTPEHSQISIPQTAQGRIRIYIRDYMDEASEEMYKEICAGVFDEENSLRAACPMLSFPQTIIQDGAAMARLWELGNGLYYAEARFAYEGVSAAYVVFQDNGDSLSFVAGAKDPGYSDGMALTDYVTGDNLFETWDYDSQKMISTLDKCFKTYGLTFSEAEINMQGGYGLAHIYTAANRLGSPDDEWMNQFVETGYTHNSVSDSTEDAEGNTDEAQDLSELAEAFYVDLAKGSRGEMVQRLQEKLIELGFLNDVADGIYGSNTYNAVAAFQQTYGLPATGIANEITRRMLLSDNSAPGHSPVREETESTGSDVLDLADYLGTDIVVMARELDMIWEYTQYSNGLLHTRTDTYSETGNVAVVGIDTPTDLYCIAGVQNGMTRGEAESILNANGWSFLNYEDYEGEYVPDCTAYYQNAAGQQLALVSKSKSTSSPVTYIAIVIGEYAWS